MTNEEVAVALDGHLHEIRSLKHRMDAVEQNQKALHSIATSVAVMTEQQKGISEKVDVIDSKVDALERRPGRRWESLVDKLLWSAAGAAVLWLLSGAPGAGL